MYEQPNPLSRQINIAIIASVFLCSVFIALAVFGYGTLRYDRGSDQSLYINGHKVDEASVKLRPGTYEVSVKSAKNTTTHQQIKVGLFQSVTLKPNLTQRDPDALAASVIGSYGLYGPPRLAEVEWFDNYTWLAAKVGPGSLAYIALRYSGDAWKVAYFTNTGYPSDIDDLPDDVKSYLTSLQTQESPQ